MWHARLIGFFVLRKKYLTLTWKVCTNSADFQVPYLSSAAGAAAAAAARSKWYFQKEKKLPQALWSWLTGVGEVHLLFSVDTLRCAFLSVKRQSQPANHIDVTSEQSVDSGNLGRFNCTLLKNSHHLGTLFPRCIVRHGGVQTNDMRSAFNEDLTEAGALWRSAFRVCSRLSFNLGWKDSIWQWCLFRLWSFLLNACQVVLKKKVSVSFFQYQIFWSIDGPHCARNSAQTLNVCVKIHPSIH